MIVAVSLGVLVGLASLVSVVVLLLAAAAAFGRFLRHVGEPELLAPPVRLIRATDAERQAAA
ncbi:MAG TPA: hypothetical protein VMT03_17705 [Polyangia bacterium]|nr:hypothetical protein [Polyangia bacterium]